MRATLGVMWLAATYGVPPIVPSPSPAPAPACLSALPSPAPLPGIRPSPLSCPVLPSTSPTTRFALSSVLGCCAEESTHVVTDEGCRNAHSVLGGSYCYSDPTYNIVNIDAKSLQLWEIERHQLLNLKACAAGRPSHVTLLGTCVAHPLPLAYTPIYGMLGAPQPVPGPSDAMFPLLQTEHARAWGNMAVSGDGSVRAYAYRETQDGIVGQTGTSDGRLRSVERVHVYTDKRYNLGGEATLINIDAGGTCEDRGLPPATDMDCVRIAQKRGMQFKAIYSASQQNALPGGCFVYSINPSSSVGYLYWNPKSSNTYETTAATQRKIWGCGPLMAKDTGPCAAPDVLISEKGVCEAYAKSMGLPFSTVDFNPTSYPPHPKCYWSGNRVYFYANSVVSSASSQCGPDRSNPSTCSGFQFVCAKSASTPVSILQEDGDCEVDPLYLGGGKTRLCHFGHGLALNHDGDVLVIGSPKKLVACPGWRSKHSNCLGSVRIYRADTHGHFVLDKEFQARAQDIDRISGWSRPTGSNWMLQQSFLPRFDIGLNVAVTGTKDFIVVAFYGRFHDDDEPDVQNYWWYNQPYSLTMVDARPCGATVMYVSDRLGLISKYRASPATTNLDYTTSEYVRIYSTSVSKYSDDPSNTPGYGETCLSFSAVDLTKVWEPLQFINDQQHGDHKLGALVMGSPLREDVTSWPRPRTRDWDSPRESRVAVAWIELTFHDSGWQGSDNSDDPSNIRVQTSIELPRPMIDDHASSRGRIGWGDECAISADSTAVAVGTYSSVIVFTMEDADVVRTDAANIADFTDLGEAWRERWFEEVDMNDQLMTTVKPSLTTDGLNLGIFVRDFYDAHGVLVAGLQVWDLSHEYKPGKTHEIVFGPHMYGGSQRSDTFENRVFQLAISTDRSRFSYQGELHDANYLELPDVDLVIYLVSDGSYGTHDVPAYTGPLDLWPRFVDVDWGMRQQQQQNAAASSGIVGCFYDANDATVWFDPFGTITSDRQVQTVCERTGVLAPDLCDIASYEGLTTDESCQMVLDGGRTCEDSWYTMCGVSHPTDDAFTNVPIKDFGCSQCAPSAPSSPDPCNLASYEGLSPDETCQMVLDGRTCEDTWYTMCGVPHPEDDAFTHVQFMYFGCPQCTQTGDPPPSPTPLPPPSSPSPSPPPPSPPPPLPSPPPPTILRTSSFSCCSFSWLRRSSSYSRFMRCICSSCQSKSHRRGRQGMERAKARVGAAARKHLLLDTEVLLAHARCVPPSKLCCNARSHAAR